MGLGLTGMAAGTTLALASWSVDGPSFNHAASGLGHNLLGAPEAIAADLIMQLLGLSSIVFLAPPILWGWRLPTTRRLERLTARLMLWLGCSCVRWDLRPCCRRFRIILEDFIGTTNEKIYHSGFDGDCCLWRIRLIVCCFFRTCLIDG